MSTFHLPTPFEDVLVSIPDNITQDELMRFPPFKNWLATLQQSFALQTNTSHIFHDTNERFFLHEVTIQVVDWFNRTRLTGFLKMQTVVKNTNNEKLPGIVFMRGGSVAILMIVRSTSDPSERLVIMTQQPRIPAGSLSFFEIPAGMIDDKGTFIGAAATEVKEETGIKVEEEDLIDMTALALANAQSSEGHLKKAMYPSPGGSDEYIALFLWQRELTRMQINELRKRVAGVDNEKIKVKLVKYEELWREGARDAKTLAAWALYEGLTREGTINALR